MSPSIARNILLMEDNDEVRTDLVEKLREAPEGWEVDAASTVEAATAYLNNPDAQYFVAILDFKVPSGGVIVDDRTVCRTIRHKWRRHETRIIHLTKFISDPTIRQHMDDVHEGEDGSLDVISKLDEDYPAKTVDKVRQSFYGSLIEMELRRTFQEDAGAPQSELFGIRDSGYSGSFTGNLSGLTTLVTLYWQYLDDGMKQRVRSFLYVDEGHSPMYVSILPPEHAGNG